ncbi:MAG: nucleotidyltransferase domain-containing protein, partial [Phycisphaerae bacterium]|nr:nucleotidyltransferase domain-containing protein [Phycisphaerae bacterium]
MNAKTDVAELLKDLGFIVGFTGFQGYIRLEHPELIVEFLVPEKGRDSSKPYSLPQLGINAQALRFMEFLAQKTITSITEGVKVTLPHPAYFALHKLRIMNRRPTLEKKEKDKDSAIRILNALIEKDQGESIKRAFCTMPKKWQSKVKSQLTDITERHILGVLEAAND